MDSTTFVGRAAKVKIKSYALIGRVQLFFVTDDSFPFQHHNAPKVGQRM
jgi:hypothetical protein